MIIFTQTYFISVSWYASSSSSSLLTSSSLLLLSSFFTFLFPGQTSSSIVIISKRWTFKYVQCSVFSVQVYDTRDMFTAHWLNGFDGFYLILLRGFFFFFFSYSLLVLLFILMRLILGTLEAELISMIRTFCLANIDFQTIVRFNIIWCRLFIFSFCSLNHMFNYILLLFYFILLL